MANKTIGELTQASYVSDNDLFVLEQNNIAKSVKGSQFRYYAESAGYDAALEATTHLPKVGDNGNWWEWDKDLQRYVDTLRPVSTPAGAIRKGSYSGNVDNCSEDGGFLTLSNATGVPAGTSGYGILFNIVWDSDYIQQMLMDYMTDGLFTRQKLNGIWTDWNKYISSANSIKSMAYGTEEDRPSAADNEGMIYFQQLGGSENV